MNNTPAAKRCHAVHAVHAAPARQRALAFFLLRPMKYRDRNCRLLCCCCCACCAAPPLAASPSSAGGLRGLGHGRTSVIDPTLRTSRRMRECTQPSQATKSSLLSAITST